MLLVGVSQRDPSRSILRPIAGFFLLFARYFLLFVLWWCDVEWRDVVLVMSMLCDVMWCDYLTQCVGWDVMSTWCGSVMYCNWRDDVLWTTGAPMSQQNPWDIHANAWCSLGMRDAKRLRQGRVHVSALPQSITPAWYYSGFLRKHAKDQHLSFCWVFVLFVFCFVIMSWYSGDFNVMTHCFAKCEDTCCHAECHCNLLWCMFYLLSQCEMNTRATTGS